MSDKLPITIITGFLGSGKTTLLKRLIKQNVNQKLLYLVNDFSANNVDGEQLQAEGVNLKSVSGGSIFCNCKITEFVEVLNSILRSENEISEVVIETSGIANPLIANTMLMESSLHSNFLIKQTICLIDPTNFLQLYPNLLNIKKQVKAADLLVINKTDLVDNNLINEIKSTVQTLNNSARILLTNYCRIDFNNFDTTSTPKPLIHEAQNAADYSSYSIKSERDINLDVLKNFAAENMNIYRIKGFMFIAGKMHNLSYSGSGWQIEISESTVTAHVEFIYKKEVQLNFRDLTQTLFISK